jgi:predicted HD superfamily hydrolase involved in NAD metabolism
VGDLLLPPTLQSRLDGLPRGLRAHIDRVRGIARELAAVHGIDEDLAELTAAAHDVARHIPGTQLIEEAERIGISVNSVERVVPILLHGPVGAAWITEDASISDPGVVEGVRWHTTAHPDLAPVGQVVFIADKLDPHKAKSYPFQAQVREAAFRDLQGGALAFLDGMMRQHVDRGDMVHPLCTDTRNALLLAAMGC